LQELSLVGKPQLTLGDRIIDLATGQISTGQRLRPLELRLLQLLASRPGENVPQEVILTEALGYAANTRSHALYTTIYRLRAAIEPDPTTPRYIVAHRGEGYGLANARLLPAEEEPLLPPEMDTFVGRAEQLARLASLEVPLVTLVGPGGAGKSRLARRSLADRRWPGGAWLVSLAGLEPAQVLPAVYAELRVPGAPSLAGLAARLRALERCVVILDGAEHVLPEVRALIEAARPVAPEARLLVTSRSPLGLAGEHLVEVGPLGEDEAIALLVARASEAGAVLPLDRQRAVLAELASRLDRLPLALELAAGWLATFPPDTVLAQLDGGLASTRADRPTRHQSLDAVLAWTWDALDAATREAAARLSVLDGAFGLAVAEAALQDPDAASVIVRLHQLGLLTASPLRQAKPFAQLHTLKQAIRARTPPELRESTLDRVAAFTRARADTITPEGLPGWFDGDQGEAGTEAALQRSPLDERRAIALCEVLRRRGAQAERLAVAESALRSAAPAWSARLRLELAGALADLGRGPEAASLWTEVMEAPDAAPILRAYACLKLARRSLATGTFSEVDALVVTLERHLGECEPGHRSWLPGSTLHLRATRSMLRGDGRAAAELFAAAERAYSEAGSAPKAALCRVNAAVALVQAGRPLAALEALQEGLQRLSVRTEDEARSQLGVARMMLGEALLRSAPEAATAALARAETECRVAGLTPWAHAARAVQAQAAIFRGEARAALATVRELQLAIADDVRMGPIVAVHLAEVLALASLGRLDEALEVAERALSRAARFEVPYDRMIVAAAHGELLVGAGRLDEARRRVEEALAELPEFVAPVPQLVLLVAELRRWNDDRRSALDAVRKLLETELDPLTRCRAAALAASLGAELGAELGVEPGAGLVALQEEARDLRDAQGVTEGWVRVYLARAGVRGERPAVPGHALVLGRAVREVWEELADRSHSSRTPGG
jgi:predicted ATPase/DNA-binding winged helix-turn-helix (wHTH) protein